MSEYRLINCEKTKKFYLESITHGNHFILFDDQALAHNTKLSLMLGTMACPQIAPELYNKLNENYLEKTVFVPRDLAYREDEISCERTAQQIYEESIEDCCQSGCSGCPFYQGSN